MTRWLTIVGMGEDGHEGLSATARTALSQAEVIIGSKRLLGMLPTLDAELQEWPQPFSAAVDRIAPLKGRRTVVLATGDPLNYGVARKLLEIVPFSETEIVPHLSAFSLAAARMGWSLPDCDTLTLHGREAATLEPYIQPGVHLLVLTSDGSTVAEVARRLSDRGFGPSEITVLENMGGARERLSRFRADAMSANDYSDLNTLAIRCIAARDARFLPRAAGLPDEAFMHDGKLTKREVRAATLAALGPAPDQVLWDIGAGCGSVAIEWMRLARGAMAIAVEPLPERLRMIAENAQALGTPRLEIVAGTAPEALSGRPAPDAVFIGGGIGDDGVFDAAWAALKPGGRLAANTVTLEGELHLVDLQQAHGGELVRIDVSTLGHVGPYRALKPRMPVLQWRVQKPW